MKTIRFFFIFMVCLLPSLGFAGTAHYVDANAAGGGDGSWATPFKTVAEVNAHSFSDGDEVYFKVGQTWTPTTRLSIDWDGVDEGDRAIIGAYYGKNQFGLNGNPMPIIDGQLIYPGTQSGLVRYYGRATGYVTIKDLQVQNVDGSGIEINGWQGPGTYTSYNNVENCYTKNTTYQGIIFARASYSTIENNIVERASYNRAPGAGLEVTGMGNETVTLNNTIRGNKVYWCFEGIGVYKGARYTTVENNVVYDNRSFHLYVANARNAVIRYNLVYETPNQLPGNGKDYLIGIDCEGHVPSIIKVTGNVEIYGNLIAGGKYGIFILNNALDVGIYQTDNLVYNNTIVDCEKNFYIRNPSPLSSGNVIKNNISWTISNGSVHSNIFSPPGFTWSNNNFDDPVNGYAANNAKIYDPELSKKSGWRSLTPGKVTGAEFNLTPRSKNIDNGILISGYEYRISISDYTVNPVKVQTANNSVQVIGAMMLGLQEEPNSALSAPDNLNIIRTTPSKP